METCLFEVKVAIPEKPVPPYVEIKRGILVSIVHGGHIFGFAESFRTDASRLRLGIHRLSPAARIDAMEDNVADGRLAQLTGQLRGLNQAQRNISNGNMLLESAWAGMNEITYMLIRQRELILLAMHDSANREQREIFQREIEQITHNINRLTQFAEFNGMRHLVAGTSASGGGIASPVTNVLAARSENTVAYIGTPSPPANLSSTGNGGNSDAGTGDHEWEFGPGNPDIGIREGLPPGNIWLQVGANSGDGMWLRMFDARPEALGTSVLNVMSQAAANQSLDAIDAALESALFYRGFTSAQLSRLDFIRRSNNDQIHNLESARVNLISAQAEREARELAVSRVNQQIAMGAIGDARRRMADMPGFMHALQSRY